MQSPYDTCLNYSLRGLGISLQDAFARMVTQRPPGSHGLKSSQCFSFRSILLPFFGYFYYLHVCDPEDMPSMPHTITAPEQTV